jgi:hypothetical protein
MHVSRLLPALAAGLSIIATPSIAADPAMYGYVLFGQSPAGATVPMARIVIDGADRACPSLTGTGTSVPMTARANPNPSTFPVTVCEAVYPTGQSFKVGSATITLPAVSATTPKRVVVLGDTGCRNDPAKQPCTPTAWPFAQVVAAAARQKPDLMIHVGDYNYRGTPSKITLQGQKKAVKVYDAGDADDEDDEAVETEPAYYSQNMTGSSSPDGWAAWQADFFAPAQASLPAAPWIFVRGNHELCSRAGPGYFYFLDSSSVLLGGRAVQTACPDQNGTLPSTLWFNQPYKITLGSLAFVVIDSANADDTASGNQAQYNTQLATVATLITKGTPAWVLTHRPFWGVMKPDKSATTPSVINETLQTALGKTPGGAFSSDVKLVVSGHMHRFQSIGFNTTRPPQLIVGDSGVGLSHTYPKPDKKHPADPFSLPVAGATGTGVGQSTFAFMRIEPALSGTWTSKLLDAKSNKVAECRSDWATAKPKQAVCVLK